MAKSFPVHYRYDDYATEAGVVVRLSRYYPIRETECFYFVVNELDKKHIDSAGLIPSWIKPKRVSKTSLRRHAYPSKEQALESFKKRKKMQIWHADFSKAKAASALSAIDNSRINGDETDCGRPEFFDDVVFD